MVRFVLVPVIVAACSLAAAQVADAPRECLLEFVEPLVAGGRPLDPDEAAHECDVDGYVGEATAAVHHHGVTSHHHARVVFFLDPEGSSEDSRYFLAVGNVETWVSGTQEGSGCTYSSPVVRHAIPTPESSDHPLTDGSLSLALWMEPAAVVAGGMALVDLSVTTRCPTADGIVTTTTEHVPPWAWLFIGEPTAIGPDTSIIAGSYTSPDSTATSWSRWDYHFVRLMPAVD